MGDEELVEAIFPAASGEIEDLRRRQVARAEDRAEALAELENVQAFGAKPSPRRRGC